MFSQEDQCYLTMKCGLMCDDHVETNDIMLYPYNNVYFPDNHYYNSQPLPIEWLEIFESKEKLQDLEQGSDMLLNDLFDPVSNKNQLDYTKEPRSFLNKTLLESVKSKIKVTRPKKNNIDFTKLNKDLIKTKNLINISDLESSEVSRPFTPRTRMTTNFTKYATTRPNGGNVTSRNTEVQKNQTQRYTTTESKTRYFGTC